MFFILNFWYFLKIKWIFFRQTVVFLFIRLKSTEAFYSENTAFFTPFFYIFPLLVASMFYKRILFFTLIFTLNIKSNLLRTRFYFFVRPPFLSAKIWCFANKNVCTLFSRFFDIKWLLNIDIHAQKYTRFFHPISTQPLGVMA